ncbi:MAG: glycosyltransferase family 2 protein [Oscillatoriales cyanobacterium C42_A2020_001]|nr:glycosyltransferase family 2 protein [Leptolyngbyaceae cyanobacterium C42_A2020_001]
MTISDSKPLVSVIIPTYNRPVYLQAAIASVLNQTFQDFEIIVSDDGSRESCQLLVESFHDPRIHFRRNATNVGIAWNATYAIRAARGKYIASLNDDDQWTAQFLEKLVTSLETHSDLVLAFCDYSVMDAEGTISQALSVQQSIQEGRDRLQTGIYHPFYKIGLVDQAVFVSCAAVIRRDVIALDELPSAGVFWDYYLAYQACRSGQGAYYCSERLAQYRRHLQSENMLSGSRDTQAKIRKGRAGIYCYERFAADAPDPWIQKYFEREWAHANTTLAIGLMRDRQYATARPYLLRSLSRHPLNLRTLFALMLSYLPQSLVCPIIHLRDPGLLSRAR